MHDKIVKSQKNQYTDYMDNTETAAPQTPSPNVKADDAANMNADELDRAVAAVMSSGSPRELKRAMSALTTSSAPRNLRSALARSYRPLPHRFLEVFGSLVGRDSNHRKALRLLRKTLWELRRWDDADNWNADEIAENVTLFRNVATGTRENTLVVGFGGNSQQLMVPSYQILHALGSTGADLLLLRDPEMKFFDQGLRGMGDSPTDVAAFVGGFSRDGGYKQTISLATSAGGLMGIYAALANKWERVVAVGPDEPASHPALSGLLARLADTPKSLTETQIRVCYAGDNARNRDGANNVAALLPTVKLFPHDGPDQHNLLESITEAGNLTPYLQWHCFDAPAYGRSG